MTTHARKTAEECTSLDDIRLEIDRIDRQLVSLIAERYTYVKAVTKFKKNEDEVQAQDRYNAVLEAKRQLAIEYDLDPLMVEGMWKVMMDWFIEEEKKIIAERNHAKSEAMAEEILLLRQQIDAIIPVVQQEEALANDKEDEVKKQTEAAHKFLETMDVHSPEQCKEISELLRALSEDMLPLHEQFMQCGQKNLTISQSFRDIVKLCIDAIELFPEQSDNFTTMREIYLNAGKHYQESGELDIAIADNLKLAGNCYRDTADLYLEMSKG